MDIKEKRQILERGLAFKTKLSDAKPVVNLLDFLGKNKNSALVDYPMAAFWDSTGTLHLQKESKNKELIYLFEQKQLPKAGIDIFIRWHELAHARRTQIDIPCVENNSTCKTTNPLFIHADHGFKQTSAIELDEFLRGNTYPLTSSPP